jgi:hypothetical protein
MTRTAEAGRERGEENLPEQAGSSLGGVSGRPSWGCGQPQKVTCYAVRRPDLQRDGAAGMALDTLPVRAGPVLAASLCVLSSEIQLNNDK